MAREIPVDPHNLDLRADSTVKYDPTWDTLVDAVEELPELERSVVELLIWGGFTKVEAADTLGISRSYVHKLWRRARGLLKEKLSDSY
jgi:DNA-directed RNA polymerase specialized sigma24 family protein